MQKRFIEKLGMELSPLGVGIMRFQSENGLMSDEAFRLVEIAMSEGINYYDTGYLYNGGHSEEFVRKALVEKYPRDSFVIADKLPVWLCWQPDDMERIFNEQLTRLGTEYIDIYLLHSLHKRTWLQVYNIGVLDFLQRKLKSGRIRKVGFSFHDNADKLPMITDAFDWNMAQLQLNYYDWAVHDVKAGYEYLTDKGIPITAMEPLGGGRLVKLPERAAKYLTGKNVDTPVSAWGMRFCASLPNVSVVLTGATTEAQLRENLTVFNPLTSFNAGESVAVQNAAKALVSCGTIPCSACRYCTDGCPGEIDIPHIFQQYNDYKLFDRPVSLSWAYMDMVPAERRADKCTGCGRCSDICPQKIDIPAQLKHVHNVALMLWLFHNRQDYDKLLENAGSIAVFGAGNFGQSVVAYLNSVGGAVVRYVCDNGNKLWGTEIEGVRIVSPEELSSLAQNDNISVLIANQYHFDEIKRQCAELGLNVLN
jgi:predicted aldo/keto reductase-like oxidoreductase